MGITLRNSIKHIVLFLSVIGMVWVTLPSSAGAATHYARPTAARSNAAATQTTPEGVAPATPVAAPAEVDIPTDAVRITPADDANSIVQATPAGSTFVFTTGVHTAVEIGVRTGDTFLGEPGAVLDAAAPLNVTAFASDASTYALAGIYSDAMTALSDSCAPWYEGGIALCGHENEVYRSELLLSDGERLRHVNTVDEVVPGTWNFDAENGTVTVAELDGDLALSTADFAFAGWGADDVTIAGLELRNYASPTQMGAIDALGTSGWTIDGVVVADSHGYGIRIGRDTTVTRSVITGNGHIGIGGSAEETGFTAVGNEISDNGWLGVQPGFERGGLKVLFTDGAVITGNWVHDNASKGIWLDGYNREATISHNRVERSGQTGILYEISHSGEIFNNLLLDNHTDGDHSESYGNLQIVDSRDVEVHGNVLAGGGSQELTVYAANHEPGVANIHVRDNHITIDTDWNEGTYGVKDLRADKSSPLVGITFAGNTLDIVAAPAHIFAWDSQLVGADTWGATHGDTLI